MAGTLAPVVKQYFSDANGRPLAGARIYSYLAGTTTPTPLYADVALTTPLTNPAIADGSGRLTFYLAPTSYRIAVHNSADVLQYVVDNVPAVPANEIDLDIQGVAGEVLAERQIVFLSQGTGGTTVGTWYRTDADDVDRSTGARVVGIATTGIGVGAQGAIRVQGRVTGFTGLTVGASYYISGTAGAITAVAPGNARFIGIADSTTSLVLTVSAVAQSLPSAIVGDTLQSTSTADGSLVVGGGIQAGTGTVQVVDATGKIPAIDSTHFANLSGASLTSLNGSNVGSGTVPDGRLSSNVVLKNAAATITNTYTFQDSTNAQVFVAPAASAIAVRVMGRAADELSIMDFVDNPVTQQLVTLSASTNGLDIGVVPGGRVNVSAPLTATRVNSGSAQPGFLAYLSADQVVPTASTVTVAFDAEEYDTGGTFNVGTSVFTAPVSGVYIVAWSSEFAALASGSITMVAGGRSFTRKDTGSGSGTVMVSLTAGDTAYVSATFTGGTNTIRGGGSPVRSWFSARLMP